MNAPAPSPPSSRWGEHDAYMRQFLNRTTMLMGDEAISLLEGKTVAIAGCGGVGGAVAITLARLGVGGFTLADPGIFDEPDINRQWAAGIPSLGRNKAEVHKEILHGINPTARLRVFEQGVTHENVDDFFDGADFLVDCLDISVSLELRTKVYREAQARGIYAVTAPIFGFGTLIILAEPEGMGMDQLIEGFIREASDHSRLPPGFADYYFGPHIDRIEERIHTHRVPSSAIAPVVATGLVCAEISLIFLGELYPDPRPVTVLPEVMVIDPLRAQFKRMHYSDLFREQADGLESAPDESPEGLAAAREARRQALIDADGDITQVKSHIGVDLFSDSWAHRTLADALATETTLQPRSVSDALIDLYGFPSSVAVFRGRFAEAMLAPALARPGSVVVGNALFPTFTHHLEGVGATVLDCGIPAARDHADPHPFKGDLDLAAVAAALDAGDVSSIIVELCVNATGGHPVSLQNLRDARALADQADVPLVIDVTRAFENAVMVRDREPGMDTWALPDIVRAFCDLADACTASLTKDFPIPRGGFIGVRDASRFAQVLSNVRLMVGDGLVDGDAATVSAALDPQIAVRHAEQRVRTVAELAESLSAAGVPIVRPVGGHGAFVIAGDTAWERARELYVESGVRLAPNLGDEGLLRLAVPTAWRKADSLDQVVKALLT